MNRESPMGTAPAAAFELDQAVQILERTPQALRALLDGTSPEWLDYQEDPEAWSPRMVLIHFIHNEQVNWIPRARVVLSEAEHREFVPFEQMPEGSGENDQPIPELLSEFEQLRQQNLATLQQFNLQAADLDRTAIHPTLGEVHLKQLLSAWVVHDLNHLHQIAKTLAKRYGQAVGPWRRFLAILDL